MKEGTNNTQTVWNPVFGRDTKWQKKAQLALRVEKYKVLTKKYIETSLCIEVLSVTSSVSRTYQSKSEKK